jgi:hypothetical protein
MHRRTWDAKTTARLGLEGLQGTAVAASCHEHPISPSPYDQWREPCLAPAAHVFEAPQHPRTEARLAQENARLKTRVGERTLERNNSDALLG